MQENPSRKTNTIHTGISDNVLHTFNQVIIAIIVAGIEIVLEIEIQIPFLPL